MLVVSTAASIVASQALISGVFSILRQVRGLDGDAQGLVLGGPAGSSSGEFGDFVTLVHQCNPALAVDLCLCHFL